MARFKSSIRSAVNGVVTLACLCNPIGIATVLNAIACEASFATTVTIDFDSLSAMPNQPLVSVPLTAQLSSQIHRSTGAVFSSTLGYVAVVDATQGLTGSTPSMPNSIGGVDALGRLDYSANIEILFFDPFDVSRPFVTDFISILGDTSTQSGATATLEAFNVSGTLVGSVTQAEGASGIFLSLALPGIHRVVLSQNSSNGFYAGTIGFDNLSFNEVTPTAVPEIDPSSFGSALALAIGSLGLLERRRSQ